MASSSLCHVSVRLCVPCVCRESRITLPMHSAIKKFVDIREKKYVEAATQSTRYWHRRSAVTEVGQQVYCLVSNAVLR